MFGIKTKEAATATVSAATATKTPVPVGSVRAGMDAEELRQYIEVATSLGLAEQPALLEQRLVNFLQDENISTYSTAKVVAFLDEQFGKDKWEWRGVREVDVKHLDGWVAHSGDRRIPFGDKQYSRQIPLPVLLTIKKISEAFPSLYFYVSNQKAAEGDPFLYVTSRTCSGCIVERWDEPGFRS